MLRVERDQQGTTHDCFTEEWKLSYKIIRTIFINSKIKGVMQQFVQAQAEQLVGTDSSAVKCLRLEGPLDPFQLQVSIILLL